jgi:hypothetical protein
MRKYGEFAILLALAANLYAQPVIRRFDANPQSITAGQQVTLTWEVEKAREISIDQELGSVPRKGSKVVSPTHNVTYTITARDSAGSSRQSTVTVTVTVAPSPASSPANRDLGLARVTGRHLLPTGVPEEPGFGLYSYLLFGEPENAQNRDRYVAILRQALVEVSSLAGILANKPDIRGINVLYIPVRSVIQVDESVPDRAAELILKAYDFPRAQLLLASIDDHYQKGPYFVSRLTPIRFGKEVPRPYLFQDMSRADPSLASDWVRRFLSQAAREEPWNENGVESFALRFRNEIQVLATFVVPVSWKASR